MTPLDTAFIEATKNSNKQNDFYNLFLKADIFIPTYDKPQKETKKRAGENESIIPIIIESEEINYFMLFDSKEKLSAWAKREIGFVAMPGHAVVEMFGVDNPWVLNAGTEYTKVFTLEEIKWLKTTLKNSRGNKTVKAGTQILIGTPAHIPSGLLDSHKNTFKKNKEVSQAFLGQVHYMKDDEKPHLVLVLRLKPSDKSTIEAIQKDVSIATRGFLKENDYIDIYIEDGGIVSTEIIKTIQPFYKK